MNKPDWAKENAAFVHQVIAANDGFFHEEYFKQKIEEALREARTAALRELKEQCESRIGCHEDTGAATEFAYDAALGHMVVWLEAQMKEGSDGK